MCSHSFWSGCQPLFNCRFWYSWTISHQPGSPLETTAGDDREGIDIPPLLFVYMFSRKLRRATLFFFFQMMQCLLFPRGSCWIAVFCLESFTLYFNMTQGQIGPIIDAESKLFLCNAALCKSTLLVLLGVTIKGRNLFIFYSQPCLKLCTGECLCGRASFSKGAHPEVIGHRRRREGHSMPLLWIFCWRKSLPFLVVLWHYFISFQNQR